MLRAIKKQFCQFMRVVHRNNGWLYVVVVRTNLKFTLVPASFDIEIFKEGRNISPHGFPCEGDQLPLAVIVCIVKSTEQKLILPWPCQVTVPLSTEKLFALRLGTSSSFARQEMCVINCPVRAPRFHARLH